MTLVHPMYGFKTCIKMPLSGVFSFLDVDLIKTVTIIEIIALHKESELVLTDQALK